MMMISMPRNFKIGDTAPVKINGAPTTLTWKSASCVVIGNDDEHPVVVMKDHDSITFVG